jgi:perosamine synthetase
MELKVREYEVGSEFGPEEIEAVRTLLASGRTLAYGPLRDTFEREFAEYCGAKYAISVTSATTALHVATQLLHLTERDQIIGTPQTFRATYISAASRRVKIRFADIDPRTLNIDPSTIEDKITSRTRAIYVVDYGGNPVDLAPIMEIAAKHHLYVVEDAAHAPGAEYRGKKIGAIADITCFSFHSLKNMNTFGEGGMLTTSRPEFADAVKSLRTMGVIGEQRVRAPQAIGPHAKPAFKISDHAGESYIKDYTRIDEWGGNYRISEVQALIGSLQLKRLDALNRRRAEVAARYHKGLSSIEGIRTPETTPGSTNVWHLYPCFLDRSVVKASRDDVINYLMNTKGVEIILRYFPVHLADYMRYEGHRYGECPVCERVWFEEQMNLPINPKMPVEEIDYVVEAVRETIRHFQ